MMERVDQVLELVALEEGQAPAQGGRRVRAIGVTADVVNGNRRRYGRPVLERALAHLTQHLHESPGQGRLIALGEAEHPSDKGGRPSLLETVVKWQAANLSGNQMLLEGTILPTSKGRDMMTLVEHGVPVGVSLRGYGAWEPVDVDGETVNEVTELVFTGFDFVLEPSDPYARLIESLQEADGSPGESEMSEELKVGIGIVQDVDEEVQRRLDVEAQKRRIGELEGQLAEAQRAQAELDARKRAEAVEAAIGEATRALAYGELNDAFVQAVRDAQPASAEAVAEVVARKRKEYDAILSKAKLAAMGKVQVQGPVFERETGQPEFTKPAFLIVERMAQRGMGTVRKWHEVTTPGELFARRYLEAFDVTYRRELLAEAQMLQEAEQTGDLNLPYSVSRAIVAEAVPELVAASVFDFDLADTSPTRIYYEAYSAESGATATITDETYTADLDDWVALAHGRVIPGTLVVELGGTSTVKTEYTDYVVDYANGKVMILSTGSISNSADLDVTYQYNSVREGEMAAIQRGKGTLSYQTIELKADRLAQQISDEAVTFARTQLGWDATTRTLAMLVREIREMIDQGVMRRAIAAAHIAANSGGTWTSSTDSYALLVARIGTAKVAVQNDNYEPTAILMSLTNADKLSNWDGFTAGGMRVDTMQRPGLLGAGDTGLRIKGLPVFASKHMPDSKALVVNREAVQHRVLASKPMSMRGPYPSYSSTNLVAAEQYFIEEYNWTDSLIAAKAGYITIA